MGSYDVAIFGAGPVGLTLAFLLARTSTARVVIVDRYAPERALADPRAIALSAGSLQLLSRVIDCSTLTMAPIRTVHVSQRERFGQTVLRHSDERVAMLGAVVRYRDLVGALDTAAHAAQVDIRRPAIIETLTENDDGARWRDAIGEAHARVLVHAEGGVYARATSSLSDAPQRVRDYGQTAIVCEVDCSQPKPGHAFERFGVGGPIALLPTPQSGRYSLVWCVQDHEAAALIESDATVFAQRLRRTFGGALGELFVATPRQAYPLGMKQSRDVDSARSVRIGNAAQTLHPVAGQGLNLGLRDAHDLAVELRGALAAHDETAALQRFRRHRKADRRLTLAVTDALARGFAADAPIAHRIAGFGLALVDQLPIARSALARGMMFGSRA